MKAYLRAVRIAPKKANLVAGMVRGQTVPEAIQTLERTNKTAARIILKLLMSAVANAEFNEKQSRGDLVIKTLMVNKAQTYHRGVPMARGRVRPMRKFLSHIELTLGVAGAADSEKQQETASKAAAHSAIKAMKSARGGSKDTSASASALRSKAKASKPSTGSKGKKSSSSK